MLIPLPIIHLFVINWSSRYQNHYEYIALDPFLGVFFFIKNQTRLLEGFLLLVLMRNQDA